jgi:hypothetical protein
VPPEKKTGGLQTEKLKTEMSALKALLTKDSEGNDIQLEIKAYVEFLVSEFEVKDIETEGQGITPAKSAVAFLVDTIAVKGKEVEEEIEAKLPDVIARIREDVANTQKALKSEKDKAADEKAAAAAKKEADKKAAEEKAAELKVTQGAFVSAVNTGFDQALKEFKSDVEALKEGLPEGITIEQNGDGYGVALAEGTSKDTVGLALGYFIGKSEGNKYLGNQLQFFAGDLTNQAVAQGIYPDMKSAAKGISEHLKEQGKTLAPASIESYTRLSKRTPAHLRNPEADTTAYLELSRIKQPKKQDKEEQKAFEARKEKLETGIKEIQEKLGKGEIRNRKDVLPLIQELEYNTGLKERPDPNAAKPTSITTYLKNFFLASIGIEKLDGVHGVKGEIKYLDEDGKTIHTVSAGDLERLKSEAELNLLNAFYETKTVKPKDYLRGYVIETKEKAIGTKPDGTAITEPEQVKTPVYPPVFFPIEKEEEDNGSNEEDQAEKAQEAPAEPAAEEKPAKGKKK